MVTFLCIDCRVEVTDVVGECVPDPALCMVCKVIRSVSEEDRPALRKAFHQLDGVIAVGVEMEKQES